MIRNRFLVTFCYCGLVTRQALTPAAQTSRPEQSLCNHSTAEFAADLHRDSD